jgi:transcriptional regulator with XRE-family HTH domain
MGAARRAGRDRLRISTFNGQLPTFDGPAFASWLRRWRDAERLDWATIAERSGLSTSIIQQLARGIPQKNARERGQVDIDPRITTIARLAHGLDLEFGYVASKAGLAPHDGGRWSAFTADERLELARVLRDELDLHAAVGSDPPAPELRRLLDELEDTLPI